MRPSLAGPNAPPYEQVVELMKEIGARIRELVPDMPDDELESALDDLQSRLDEYAGPDLSI